MVSTSRDVVLITDGACSGNPGPGGWAYIIREAGTNQEQRGSGAERLTTNNRMELLSVIHGLRTLSERTNVTLVTDSSYVAKGIEEWMAGWKSRGWMRKEGRQLKPVKNAELWQELDQLCSAHNVRCEWVRGHAGHDDNEECDRMAVAAYQEMLARDRLS